jgi:hypothetical protein
MTQQKNYWGKDILYFVLPVVIYLEEITFPIPSHMYHSYTSRKPSQSLLSSERRLQKEHVCKGFGCRRKSVGVIQEDWHQRVSRKVTHRCTSTVELRAVDGNEAVTQYLLQNWDFGPRDWAILESETVKYKKV